MSNRSAGCSNYREHSVWSGKVQNGHSGEPGVAACDQPDGRSAERGYPSSVQPLSIPWRVLTLRFATSA